MKSKSNTRFSAAMITTNTENPIANPPFPWISGTSTPKNDNPHETR